MYAKIAKYCSWALAIIGVIILIWGSMTGFESNGGTPVDVTTLMLVAERICKNGAPIYIYGNKLSMFSIFFVPVPYISVLRLLF